MTKVIRIFCDGSGARADGRSGFAWKREDTGEQKIERVDGLTNNAAEYRAVIAALAAVPAKSHVEVVTDSELVVMQLRGLGFGGPAAAWGTRRIHDSKLDRLARQVIAVAKKRKLSCEITWIPRADNQAGRVLDNPKNWPPAAG